MSLDPPLPVYLISIVAGLRDKSAKGYPVKKVRQQNVLYYFSIHVGGGSFFLSYGKPFSRVVAE